MSDTNKEPLAPATGSDAPFKDRQKVSCELWDKQLPYLDKMGDCIVVSQRRTDCCESGWMITVMAPDGRCVELDSNWLMQPNDKLCRPADSNAGAAKKGIE